MPMIAVARELIPQPDRPQVPIRVPVQVEVHSTSFDAIVVGSTDSVLLVQGPENNNLPALGTPIRLKLEWDRQTLNGRLAAHGKGGRFLVSVGERAIRRSRRFPVDLPGLARSSQLYGPTEVRIKDLSTSGARVEGILLPIGDEVELTFTPPGRKAPLTVLAFVVRSIDSNDEVPALGVAFRLVQPSMDVLASAALGAPTKA
jgi:PilZ domain-containing protein